MRLSDQILADNSLVRFIDTFDQFLDRSVESLLSEKVQLIIATAANAVRVTREDKFAHFIDNGALPALEQGKDRCRLYPLSKQKLLQVHLLGQISLALLHQPFVLLYTT